MEDKFAVLDDRWTGSPGESEKNSRKLDIEMATSFFRKLCQCGSSADSADTEQGAEMRDMADGPAQHKESNTHEITRAPPHPIQLMVCVVHIGVYPCM